MAEKRAIKRAEIEKAERIRLANINDKPQRSPEERARMQAKFQALLAELRGTSLRNTGPL